MIGLASQSQRGLLTGQSATQAEEQPNALLLNDWIGLAEPDGPPYQATCYTSGGAA